MAHPTSTKERLMNKILAQLMISCAQKISAEQIEEMQTFKDNPSDFDWRESRYSLLLDFSLSKWEANPNDSEEKQKGPVEMSREEVRMQTIVEVCSSFIFIPFIYSPTNMTLGLERGDEERKGRGNEEPERRS